MGVCAKLRGAPPRCLNFFFKKNRTSCEVIFQLFIGRQGQGWGAGWGLGLAVGPHSLLICGAMAQKRPETPVLRAHQ